MPSTRQHKLTEEQKRMYASEKYDNFRWISRLLATRSSYQLTDADLAPQAVHVELAELGQFVELVCSVLPVPFLLDNYDILSQPDFPLENYEVLKGLEVVTYFKGKLKLPALVVRRPTTDQLVVAISGTTLPIHGLHDCYAFKRIHPSKKGAVHSGFWLMYMDIKDHVIDTIRTALSERRPSELVITGHSLGGSLSYLLCMDLLADDELVASGVDIKIAVFGAPRSGDQNLVRYFHDLVSSYRQRHGDSSFKEYAVKGYNDGKSIADSPCHICIEFSSHPIGVPALPPHSWGYRHFCRTPLYTTSAKLYNTPSSESEHALFDVVPGDEPPQFPRGGHNYYNGRDLEKFSRRVKWLQAAKPDEEGWEERYRSIVVKNSR